MHVEEIWRYPVKSMAGERLTVAEMRRDGIEGDRVLRVAGEHGVVTARTRHALLGHAATTTAAGDVLVDGRAWRDPSVAEDVQRAAGPGARLVSEGVRRFDVLPLLIATDGAIAAFGRDGRRLRPNLVLGGVDGLAEREWEGRLLAIGDMVILLHSLRERCVMTTFDPDTLAQDVDVLRDIRGRFGGRIALNAAVLVPGRIRVRDAAEVLVAGSHAKIL
jgi:uncharacterized protein YcbX